MKFGVNTFVWVSPCTTEAVRDLAPKVKEIARAVCIWREIAPSQDAIAQQGLGFLKMLLA
jgi:hypothetical protein